MTTKPRLTTGNFSWLMDRLTKQEGHMPSEAHVLSIIRESAEMPRARVRAEMRQWHDEHPAVPLHPQDRRNDQPKRYRVEPSSSGWTVRDWWSGDPRSMAEFYRALPDAEGHAARFAAHLEYLHGLQVATDAARRKIMAHVRQMGDAEVLGMATQLTGRRTPRFTDAL